MNLRIRPIQLWTACGAICCALAFASRASAIVLHPGNPTDLQTPIYPDYVGEYRDSSAVAVGDFWIITARHVEASGSAPQTFRLDGQTYTVAEVVFHPNPNVDLALVRVNEQLPGYYPIQNTPTEVGKTARIAGFGQGRGTEVPGMGYLWNGEPGDTKRWGANVIDSIGADPNGVQFLVFDFDLNGACGEGGLALFDSGGGVFILDIAGVWRLAAMNIGVQFFGSTFYNRNGMQDLSFAIRLGVYTPWIYSVIPAAVIPPPAVTSDFDADGDVDLADHAHLAGCMSGVNVQPPICCRNANLDTDIDVDLRDCARLFRCFSGEDQPATPGCN